MVLFGRWILGVVQNAMPRRLSVDVRGSATTQTRPSKNRIRRAVSLGLVWMALAGITGVAFGQPQLAQNWRDLSPRERRDALRNYRQHDSLPPQRQHDMEDRYERWRRLSPEEQSRIRRNYDRLQQLDPAERQRLQKRYDNWKRRTQPEP